MKTWLKEKAEKNHYFFPTSIFFLFIFLMVGGRSASIGSFLRSSLEMLIGSLLVTFLITLFLMTDIKEKREHEVTDVFGFIWAVVAFMGVLGNIWHF